MPLLSTLFGGMFNSASDRIGDSASDKIGDLCSFVGLEFADVHKLVGGLPLWGSQRKRCACVEPLT